MPPEDSIDPEKLLDAEKVVRALEALMTQCEQRGLGTFARRISSCLAACQSDYVTLQRKAFSVRNGRTRKPPPTTH